MKKAPIAAGLIPDQVVFAPSRGFGKENPRLQAISRINRPYPDKDSGLLVDYVGIFEDLQKALAFDQAEISKALIDLEELKQPQRSGCHRVAQSSRRASRLQSVWSGE